jgi:hypothetical protein
MQLSSSLNFRHSSLDQEETAVKFKLFLDWKPYLYGLSPKLTAPKLLSTIQQPEDKP